MTWELHLAACHSLKDKRHVLKSLKDRLHNRFNVSAAETAHHDLWQRAELTACVVATDRRHAESVLREADRQTVAEFLTGNVRDPRVGFVTVTAVDVSADLGHARVRVSVMGSEEEKAKSLEGLASAARFLRAAVAKELPLRTTPELHFELDRGLEHAQRIDQLLRDLKEGAG